MTWLSTVRERYSVTTNPLRSERKIELIALLLGLVLCFQVLYSGIRYAQIPEFDAVAPAQDALTISQIRALAGVSTGQSEQIRSRPLFWESRRPVEPVAVTDKAEDSRVKKEGKLKDVTLLGVFGGGATAGIIVKVKDKKRRILLGEEIEGWTLESVQANKVVFSAGGRTKKLQLLARNDFVDVPPATGGTASPGRPRPAVAKEVGEESLSLGGTRGK